MCLQGVSRWWRESGGQPAAGRAPFRRLLRVAVPRAADLNGDGRDDVIHTRTADTPDMEFYWHHDGSRWQPCGFRFLHGIGAGDIAAGDLDGDGWPDIVGGANAHAFGSHATPHLTFSQWNRNDRGRIEDAPAFVFSSLGREPRANDRLHGMDNGSYDLADLNGDGHLDVVFSGSHEGFQGDWEEPYWVCPESPEGRPRWIHYDLVTFTQTPPYDGRRWKVWEFNGGGAGCVQLSCVKAADSTRDRRPEVAHIGHASQRLLPPPYDMPRRRGDGFEGARHSPKGKTFHHAKYTPTIRVFENDGRGGLRYVYHEALIPVDYRNIT